MFRYHLPHVRAGRDLERADITPAKVHPVVTEVRSAIEIITNDAADAGSDSKFAFEFRVADCRNPFIDVQVVGDDMFLTRCFVLCDFDRLQWVIERSRDLSGPVDRTVKSEHAVDNIDVGEQIGDGASVGFPLDVFEQDRRPAIQVFLKSRDFEIGIDLLLCLYQISIGTKPVDRRAQAGNVASRREYLL
jgi:hypothetical protein